VKVEQSAVDDAHLGKQLGVLHQIQDRLPVGEFVDGEGLAETDPVGRVTNHQQQRQSNPAQYPEELLHCR
jgi:hypothetical protein